MFVLILHSQGDHQNNNLNLIPFLFSPYSDMALLPILAFFFCSAGPFLFTLFAIRRLIDKIRGRETDPINSRKMTFEKVSKEEERTDIY